MRCAALGLATLMGVSSPLAQDDGIAHRATRCLNLSPAQYASSAIAEIAVSLDTRGLVTGIDVIGYEPQNEAGRATALKSAEAIEHCGPYPGATDETILIGPGVEQTEKSIIAMPD